MSPRLALLWATCHLAALPALGVESQASTVIPDRLTEAGIDQRIGEQVPLEIPFVDSTGDPVTLGQFFGDRPVLMVPVYYHCPMLCPITLEGMARSLKALHFGAETDYELVVYSFDPEDTPQMAAEQRSRALETFGREGEGGWHFLTGPRSSVEALNEAIGFRVVHDEATNEFFHAATMLILTPEGTIARYFYGVEFAPKDLRLGLVEASEGELGNPVDQVLLYCFRYDPAAGRYTMLTMRLLRIGATVTIFGLAAMILIFLRLERTRQRPPEGTA